ncbi:MAG: hypothetical protein A3F74_06970 [Betaproteobacteria bacterium RIFCSPLOWO2_12_FULL_62_58]|nr:MAG: hypothetical protein A3F74_06970 [Betaproteobacteria bacterium RIFCSPLOWO2_12_FULL_62_58]
MRAETHLYSPRYARRLIALRGAEHLRRDSGGVLAFLHFGSFFLSGGALVHQLGLPYTLIASRRNLALLPPAEADFWRGVHERSARLFGAPLFFSDEPATNLTRWLKEGKFLGAAMDVRETGFEQRSGRFDFLGARLHLHLGPGRLAAMTGRPLHAMTILFDPERRRHELHLGPPVFERDPEILIQRALDDMAPIVSRAPWQLYHDLFGIFAQPHEAAPMLGVCRA